MVISRVHNRFQNYLKAVNSFPNELEFTDNVSEAYLFRSMTGAKRFVMSRPSWTIYSIERVDNNKRIKFKKYRRPQDC
jgi:hypothetical protein